MMVPKRPLVDPAVPVADGSAAIVYDNKPLKIKKMESSIFYLRAIN